MEGFGDLGFGVAEGLEDGDVVAGDELAVRVLGPEEVEEDRQGAAHQGRNVVVEAVCSAVLSHCRRGR